MKHTLTILIFLAIALMTFQAADNIRQARAPLGIEQELSPAQLTALLADLEAKGIKLHPAKYWKALK